VELAVFLVLTPPPSSLWLSSPSRRLLAGAAAIADSLGQSRSSFQKWATSPKNIRGFKKPHR
jgi:hypothetical protein